MPRQPTKRALASESAPDVTKRSRRSVHRAPMSSAASIRPSVPAPSSPASPVRILIFREGQAYTPYTLDPPATSHLAEGDDSNHMMPTQPAAICRSAGPSTHPSPSIALQEARGPTFPLQQALTELQVVERRVRLLLPTDASIVRPGAIHPATNRTPAVIPAPDPFMWVNDYVSHSFYFRLFSLPSLVYHSRTVRITLKPRETPQDITRPGIPRPRFPQLTTSLIPSPMLGWTIGEICSCYGRGCRELSRHCLPRDEKLNVCFLEGLNRSQ
jgi:hypothetical protein